MLNIEDPKYLHHDKELLEEAYQIARKKGYRANFITSAIIGIGILVVPLSLVVGAVRIGSAESSLYGLVAIFGICLGFAIHPYRDEAAKKKLRLRTDQIYNAMVSEIELFNRVKNGSS